MISVPELRTERTLMRGWREEDLDAIAAWSADSEVMRYVGGVQDREQAWRNMALYLGHWHLRGYGLWAATRAEDGAVIGRVGLWNPEGWAGVEVGWTFARATWGAGYATECGRAALDWGWRALPGTERILSVIATENTRSRNVAERLGMALLGPYRTLGGFATVLYGIERRNVDAAPMPTSAP